MFTQGKWRLTIALVALACTAAITGCKKTAANRFPPSGAVAGWEKTGETRTFAAKDLWQYIDGEADEYLQAGLVSASTSDYKYQGQLEAVVDIYTMGDATGASKMLAKDQSKDAQSVALGDAGIAYAQSVTFRKGSNLVRIVAYESTATAEQALLALGHGIDARL